MAHTKGIIDIYIDINKLGELIDNKSHNIDQQIINILDNFPCKKNYFTNENNSHEDLYKSFYEVILVERICYMKEDVDFFIIYKENTEATPYKIAVIWRSDDDLAKVINTTQRVVKKFLESILLKNVDDNKLDIDKIPFRCKIYQNNKLLKNKSIAFYAFFRNTDVRDPSVSVSNLKLDLKTKNLFDPIKIFNFLFVLGLNILLFFFNVIKISAVFTTLGGLISYILGNYFLGKKSQIELKISSLAFNDNDIRILENTKEDEELNNLDLSIPPDEGEEK